MRWCFDGSTQIESRPIWSSHWVCICVCASGGCWVIGSSKKNQKFLCGYFLSLFFNLVHPSFKLCSPEQISLLCKIWAKVKEVKLITRKTGGRSPRFCSPDPFLSAAQLPCIEVCFVPMMAFIQLCLIRVTNQKGNRYDVIDKILLQDLDRLLVNLCIWRNSTNVKQLGAGFYLFAKCLAPSKCSHGAN